MNNPEDVSSKEEQKTMCQSFMSLTGTNATLAHNALKKENWSLEVSDIMGNYKMLCSPFTLSVC